MNRQKLLLVILLGVLVLALVHAFWKAPRQNRVVSPVPGPAPRPTPAPSQKEASPPSRYQVRIDLLAREKEPFPGAERNLFGPIYVVKPPPPPPPPPPVKAPPPPPPSRAAPPAPPPVVRKPLASFNFLGFLEKTSERTVFLSLGEEIFAVHEGDRFGKDREFLATELTPDKLIIRQGDDPREITVSLAEKEPPAPPGTGPGKMDNFKIFPYPKPLFDPFPARPRTR